MLFIFYSKTVVVMRLWSCGRIHEVAFMRSQSCCRIHEVAVPISYPLRLRVFGVTSPTLLTEGRGGQILQFQCSTYFFKCSTNIFKFSNFLINFHEFYVLQISNFIKIIATLGRPMETRILFFTFFYYFA